LQFTGLPNPYNRYFRFGLVESPQRLTYKAVKESFRMRREAARIESMEKRSQ
jgi:hypothetical protein